MSFRSARGLLRSRPVLALQPSHTPCAVFSEIYRRVSRRSIKDFHTEEGLLGDSRPLTLLRALSQSQAPEPEQSRRIRQCCQL